jgi:peptidoglycan-associated lipoprotein
MHAERFVEPRMSRLLAPLALLALVGCPKPAPPEPPPAPTVTEAPPPRKEVPAPVQEMVANFSKVLFDFDSAELNADGKAALDANAAIMAEYPDIRLEVQGHADERGTTEYNLALGQKRADAVVRYLLGRNVSTARVKSVSYGEERPVDGLSTETAHAANRRAEFVVTWSGDAPVRGTAN